MAKSIRARKLAKDLRRVKRDVKLKPPATRRNATKALAQAAAAAPRRNFGTRMAAGTIRACRLALDARIPRTIGLPRAVGPYSVIRTTRLHSSSANFIIFAPFMSSSDKWYNWCGIEDVLSSDPVNGNNNTHPIVIPLAELSNAAEVVPAALTVQVMNPASLQTANGVFAMGRANQPFNYANYTGTWDALRARFISYFSPRLLTGGKLALRGVKCSTYPLDMSEYSDFAPVEDFTADFTWNGAKSSALAPIIFTQANEAPQELEFLITVEWRVRFDPGNPAVASHTHHDTTSDSIWNGVCRDMSAAGHGVEELAEDVMELGAMAGGVRMAGAALL
uniref:Putative capsid n=1 Tax=Barns Ness breadcrumb sponge weivirus-like virus 1 TaxID=2021887 RepID=A0A221LFG4_9VIRU|nr:putative capsid [Barns Ness breadcrumb sponge weivirus-like virus 1]